ncbi:MFS transporter [Cupriavidus numazuensis]|uniref:Hexuronate transporter n=1 Tax=Cupriavidus numazuensis TaxID=221992 RepID=A0ABN7QA46_9BURK|nr:MFS transporter [Cupriavidus numazuensis]CAG2159290.1 Hexuronate transporter [Cupriavidus numazuensis]
MNDSHTFRAGPAWTIVVLLLLYMLVNFLDKIALSMTAAPLMAELNLSATEFGTIAGSFYWLFSLSGILGGLLSRRIDARWLLLGMGILWAVLQIPVIFASSARELLWARMLLGAAEGPAFPIAAVALFRWFPDDRRNLPISIVSSGASVGLILAGLMIPAISAAWGWRSNFVLLAVMGAVWSVLWLCVGCNRRLLRGGTGAPVAASNKGAHGLPDSLPYRKLLTDRSVIAILGAGAAGYTALGVTMTWLPLYLERGLGYSATSAGQWFTVVVLIIVPVQIILSAVSQRLLRRGFSSRTARARLLAVAMLTSALLMIALGQLPLTPPQKAITVALACGLGNLAIVFGSVMLAEVTPQRQLAVLIAVLTAVGNMAAAVAAAATGRFVDTAGAENAHGYEMGYVIAAAMLLCGALACLRWLHTDRSRQNLCAKALASA